MADRVKLTQHERSIEVLAALSRGTTLRFRYQARPWVLISKDRAETSVGREVAMWLRAHFYIIQTSNRANDNFEEWDITPAGRALLTSSGKTSGE